MDQIAELEQIEIHEESCSEFDLPPPQSRNKWLYLAIAGISLPMLAVSLYWFLFSNPLSKELLPEKEDSIVSNVTGKLPNPPDTAKWRGGGTPQANAGDYYIAKVGEKITFYGVGSVDFNGTIEKFEWDFDSDGTFDVAANRLTTDYTYPREYIGYAILRVTDNDKLFSEAVVPVFVLEEGKEYSIAPVAVAKYGGGAYTGGVGNELLFSGSGSIDPDGELVRYEWDFESDGKVDFISEEMNASHIYDTEFKGTVTLRVFDEDGLMGEDTGSVVVNKIIDPAVNAEIDRLVVET